MLNQIVLVGRLVQDPEVKEQDKNIIEIVAERVTFLSSRKEKEEE